MTTLAPKFGLTAPVLQTSFEAYARIVQAAIEGHDGALYAPAFRLNAGQLTGLFAPRQVDLLLKPLRQPPIVEAPSV